MVINVAIFLEVIKYVHLREGHTTGCLPCVTAIMAHAFRFLSVSDVVFTPKLTQKNSNLHMVLAASAGSTT